MATPEGAKLDHVEEASHSDDSSQGEDGKAPRSDYDGPWKDIIRVYFKQLMEFFFADVANLIDWSVAPLDRKSTRLNSSHVSESRMPSSA